MLNQPQIRSRTHPLPRGGTDLMGPLVALSPSAQTPFTTLQRPKKGFLTGIAGAGIDQAPAALNFFEDGIAVGIEASLSGKDFTHAVVIQIELIDEIDAGKEAFCRRLMPCSPAKKPTSV